MEKAIIEERVLELEIERTKIIITTNNLAEKFNTYKTTAEVFKVNAKKRIATLITKEGCPLYTKAYADLKPFSGKNIKELKEFLFNLSCKLYINKNW